MEDTKQDQARVTFAWHGWGSPVGMGILILCLGLSVAAVLAGFSLLF